jgi:uncharacterized protein with von Willebrand factor type A (vWA) domain
MALFRRRSRRRSADRRVSYSRWDGTQTGFDLSAADLMSEMADDLMYHGDLNAALRRLMQQGFDVDGERMQGIRELLDQLKRQRQDRLDQFDLGGVYDEIARDLNEVIETEKQALDDVLAAESGDARRDDIARQAAQEAQFHLDMLAPDLAGQMKSLESYDFTSPEAQRRFDELVERLREQLMQQFVDQMTEGVDGMSPEDLQRAKDMMAELNHMLDQRANGEEPDFAGFMDRFGDFFPENPETLDELLEAMAARMAAMQAMLNSMTPEQRAQLQALSDQLLEDMDLRWQADQLGRSLQQLFPDAGWDGHQQFQGLDPLDLGSGQQVLGELTDIDQLEQLLRGATNPGALAEVDIERARELMGDDAARSLEQMAEMAKLLEDAGLIENKDGRLEMTPRAVRRLGQQALADLFRKLRHDRPGGHELAQTGIGHERDYSTKPYEFGDPFNLDIQRTIRNAIRRTGGGTPVPLTPDDFEVERTESLVTVSTVLMLDLSLSMPMRENFLPAKKVAMALHALMSTQYPRDYLGVVAFSEVARKIKPEQLPEVSWDYVYGTNMQHGFLLARELLARQSGTKQIIMITDGEPTAHITASGQPFFSYPPSRETVDRTLAEVAACTREGIRINTFMLDATPHLTRFIEQITKMNGGRAFFTTNENLGDYVLVDFVEHRRAMVQGRRTA